MDRRDFLKSLAVGTSMGLTGARGVAAALDEIKIGLAASTLTPNYTYLVVPNALDYWTQDGLHADVLLTQGSTQVLQLMQGGQADLGIINAEPLIIGRQLRSLPFKSVAAVSLIRGPDTAVLEGSPYKSFGDLKGKSIGVFSLASGLIPRLKLQLQDEGVDMDKDVKLLPVGFGATAAEALKTGQVAALRLWDGAFAGMENEGLKLSYFALSPWEKQIYDFIIVANETAIAQKPDIIRRALRSMSRGAYFASARPEAAVQAYWRQHPEAIPAGVDPKVSFIKSTRLVAVSVNDMALAERKWGEQSSGNWAAMESFLIKSGQIKNQANPNSYFDGSLIQDVINYDIDDVKRSALAYRVDY
jgi:NitT/TauT family transport system substrate-binding protein